MVNRARLGAPPLPERNEWPWHTQRTLSLSVSTLLSGDRRFEAETYLSTGFGIRRSIEQKSSGWTTLGEVAHSWMPGRLKGIQVGKDSGTPFLAATQVFDIRPIPRKWLALSRTADANRRFVKIGQILVTCSGLVGRPTVAHSVHEDTLISHDIIRVDPLDSTRKGWIYAYLLSTQARAMATSSHYGHIIKHLETAHLDKLPVPEIDNRTALDFNRLLDRLIFLRNKSARLVAEAEALFEKAVGYPTITDWGFNGFSRKASATILSGRRRRFEAAVYNPGVEKIKELLTSNGTGFTTIKNAGYEVWLPNRFKRIPSEEGSLLLDTSSLNSTNPRPTKQIRDDGDFGDKYRGRVKQGWILLPRSGQVYGIIGTPTISLKSWENYIVSDDALRMRPTEEAIPVGYVSTALGHPQLGRPLVKALAYGSSIPHIDPTDLASFELVRIGETKEEKIGELAEAAAIARGEADMLEEKLSVDAGMIISDFIRHR